MFLFLKYFRSQWKIWVFDSELNLGVFFLPQIDTVVRCSSGSSKISLRLIEPLNYF